MFKFQKIRPFSKPKNKLDARKSGLSYFVYKSSNTSETDNSSPFLKILKTQIILTNKN